MKFTIKKRSSDEIKFEGEAESLKNLVLKNKANLSGA